MTDLTKIEAWVHAQIQACAPRQDQDLGALEQLVRACVVLKGRSGTLFGWSAPAGFTRHEALYREACTVVAQWLAGLDEGGIAEVVRFVEKHGLAVPVPRDTDAPASPPEEALDPTAVAEAERRLDYSSPLWSVQEWERLTHRWAELTDRQRSGLKAAPRFSLGEPATAETVAKIERALGERLPEELLRAFKHADWVGSGGRSRSFAVLRRSSRI
ncbi:hypothetical protein [Paraliomyxa miuraensis]|uniref:hypothetical protein n=1 Tax=Paraliomyxa miuraensis TaxID=376150 RepID=UPI002257B578|nr:hypothetical protein [Paraliomyxa miuraensis]MCX4246512.1 hypothetical protein [Paraliomyxa miuraensis]